MKKRFQVRGACKSTGGVIPKARSQKWDAGHQIPKKKAEAREKRNTVDGHLQVVLQIVGHTAERKVEGNQGQSRDLGPEIFSFAHILMIEDAGIDQAVALLMALEENEVEVAPGAEGNPIEFRDLGQKAEQEGPGQDLVHVPIVEAVKGPVTEEPAVDLEIESDVKAEIRRKEKRRRRKARTRSYTTSNVGNLETSKLD